MTDQLTAVALRNGLVIRFEDLSNRYFGNFHRVTVLVRIELPVNMELPAGISSSDACLEKKLEKMGVPGEEVDNERSALVNSFLEASRAYLEGADVPERLLKRLQQEKRKPVFMRDF